MKISLKRLACGSVVAGALMTSSMPAAAHDAWRWRNSDYTWQRRAELRRDYRDLVEARRKLAYDQAHRASRRQIVEDWRRIREIEREIEHDRWG